MTMRGASTHSDGPTGETWRGVHAALCDYLDAVDSADFARLEDLLEQATVILPTGTITGGAAIREAYQRIQPAPDKEGRRQTKHHLTNLVVSGPQKDGAVLADAYYFVLEPAPDGPRVQKTGRFHDRLERADQGWRIREHRVIPDF